MTLSIAQFFVFTVVAGFGEYIAGALFGYKMTLPVSFAVAAAGAVAYLIPGLGAYVSFLVMILGTWRFSEGELMESFSTAGVARLLVIPASLGLDALPA